MATQLQTVTTAELNQAVQAAQAAQQAAEDARDAIPESNYDLAALAADVRRLMLDGYNLSRNYALSGSSGEAPTIAEIPDLDPDALAGGWQEGNDPNTYFFDLLGKITGSPAPTITLSDSGNIALTRSGDTLIVTLQGAGETGSGTVTVTNTAGSASTSFDVLEGGTTGFQHTVAANKEPGSVSGLSDPELDAKGGVRGIMRFTMNAPKPGTSSYGYSYVHFQEGSAGDGLRVLWKGSGNAILQAVEGGTPRNILALQTDLATTYAEDDVVVVDARAASTTGALVFGIEGGTTGSTSGTAGAGSGPLSAAEIANLTPDWGTNDLGTDFSTVVKTIQWTDL